MHTIPAALLTLALAVPALAGDAPTADAVLDRHLAAFAADDVDAIMADYAPDAVFVTPFGVHAGHAEIRALFEGLVAEFSDPAAKITVLGRESAGPVAYIVWTAETPIHSYAYATDTLVVEDGLIRYQTFAADIVAKE